jgi:hypothetical protein
MTTFARDLSKRPSHDIWEGTYQPQPSGGNSLDRLIERKQMSTKTTFKRIALVAVAALGLSLVAVVPSTAASTGTAVITASADATGAVGTAVTFTITSTISSAATAADTITVTPVLTGTALSTAMTVGNTKLVPGTPTLVNATSVIAATGVQTVTAVAGSTLASAATIYTFTPDAVGTFIFTFTPTGGTTTNTAVAYTFTATASAGSIYVTGDSVGTRLGSPLAAAIAGANNFVTLNQTALAATAYNVVVTGSTATVVTAGATGTGTSSIVTPINLAIVLNIPTPTAGTITVKNYAITNGVQSATATSTVTITVAASASGTVYSASTAFISSVTGTDLAADGTTLTALSTATGSSVGYLTVSQYATTSATTRLIDAYTTAVLVTITGAGTIGTTANNRGPSAAVAAATATSGSNAGVQNFSIYADGRTGPATVVITVNGTVVATKTFTFTGAFSAYKTATVKSVLLGVGATDAIVYTGVDSFGTAVAIAGTTAATSSAATVASVTVVGNTVSVLGVASGTAVITVTNGATPAITTTLSYTVTKTTAKTVTMAFDKTEYTAGEKMVLTVSAVDSNGAGVADGARSLFTANTSATVNLIAVTTLPLISVTLSGGKATYTMYAPLATGPITVSGTEGTGTDNVAAGGTAAVISASAAVVSDGVAQAAADAAAEATDAANAATDAANAAAEAADAATAAAQDAADAVAALSTSVTAMIDALKKQITALTNLVIKIQKKVKA